MLDIVLVKDIIHWLFAVLRLLILARIVLSFLPLFMRIDPYNPIVRFINEMTEPMLAPFRRIVPPVGGVDFSPLLLFVVLELIERAVMYLVNLV